MTATVTPTATATPTEIPIGDGGGNPPPNQTPELDSLLLFGAGLGGMAGYVLTRRRAAKPRRPPDEV